VERLLLAGEPLPFWYAESQVAAQLARTVRPRTQAGFTVLFTGLSGSGKSTVAKAFVAKLLEEEARSVSLLDGDVVRTHLSKGLGFSRDDRDTNVRRIGFVAAEITKAGGIAVCAPIAPYDATRRAVREMVERHGGFVLVHVSTPMEVCEQRDRKGLYAQARAGRIPEFTGVSDPYETPADADVVVDTSRTDVADAVSLVLDRLTELGFIERGRTE
jgi:sulfate adenylyltransferase